MKRLNSALIIAVSAVLLGLPLEARAGGNAYDDAISYFITGSYTPISGASSTSISVSYDGGNWAQTATAPNTTSTRISDYADNVTTVDVTVNNASDFTLAVAIKPAFDVYINQNLARSYTVHNVDSSGNVISGQVTYHIPICVVRKWNGPSMYGAAIDTVVSKTSLGENGSVVLNTPIATKREMIRPYFDFGMGLAKNGKPLPALKVYADALPNWGFPDVPDVVMATKSSTVTWVQAPQVTAIVTTQAQFGTNAAGPTLTVQFALPGQESSPFLTYSFSTLTYAVTKSNLDGTPNTYSEQITIQKKYIDNPTTYETDVKEGVIGYPPPGYGFSPYYVNTVSYKDWHDASGTTVPRNVSLTPMQPDNSSNIYAIYQVDDGNNHVATLSRYDYTMVVNNVGGQGSFSSTWIRSKVTEAYNAQAYVTTQLFSGSDYNLAGGTDTVGGTTWWTFSTNTGVNAGLYPDTQYSPWNGNVPVFQGSTTGCKVTQFGYGADWDGTPIVTSKTISVGNVTIGTEKTAYKFTGDANGDNNTLSNKLNLVTMTTTTTTLGNATQQQVKNTYRTDNADTLYDGLPYSVQNPDGTMTAFAYERGTYSSGSVFQAQPNGPDLEITTFSGVVSGASGATTVSQTSDGTTIASIGMVPNRSTVTVDTWQRDVKSSAALPDAGRFLIRHELYLYTGTAYTLLSYETYTYQNGKLATRTSSNGATVTTTWKGDQKDTETDVLGRIHTFTYDSGGRLQSESIPGVSAAPYGSGSIPTILTTYGYDADNRLTSTSVGPSGGEQLVTSTGYDTGGRISTKTDSNGVVTTYQHSSGEQVVTETHGDGGTKITTLQPDGRKASITGTAVVNEFYTYGDDSTGRLYTKTNLGTSTGRSKTTYYDQIGREVETDTYAFGTNGSATPIAVTKEYDANGRLKKIHSIITDAQGSSHLLSADTLTLYDVLGAVTDEGLDIDGDGALTASSTDRYIHHTYTTAVNTTTNTGPWLMTTSSTYTTDNSTDTYNTEVDSQVGNFTPGTLSATVTSDRYNNTTTISTSIDTSNHWTDEATKAPDGSSHHKYSVGEFVLAEVSLDFYGNILGWTSYSYDAQSRLTGTQDSRTGTTTKNYYTGSSLVQLVRDATQTTVATYSTYDGAGRPTKVLDALGNDTQYVYNARGQVTQQSGAGVLPVQYDYNGYGEQIAMRTYRHGLTDTADWTNWTYDDNTGLLTAKIDAAAARDSSGNVTNASGHQVTFDYQYDYTNSLRKVIRTSARGAQRTESFSLVTGNSLGVTYVDAAGATSSTPSVTYTYTRDGQLSTVNDATGTRNFVYSRGDLSAEAFDPVFYKGGQNGLVATVVRESTTDVSQHTLLGRNAGFMLGYVLSSGSSADLDDELTASFSYDGVSRIAAIAAIYKAQSPRLASTTRFSYTYDSTATPWNQWHTVQQKNFSLTRGFETHRDYLNSVTAVSGTGTITDFEVNRDGAGRTQYVVQSGYAYADYGDAVHVRYTYDSVGNLQGATAYLGSTGTSTANPLPGMGLAYSYDTFGNRATASIDGTSVNYPDGTGKNGGNALNEIVSRGTLPLHVSGTIASGSAVTVNSLSASVLGNYWDAAVAQHSDGTGAFYSSLPITASNGGQSASTTVAALVRPSSESYTYDADGNLTLDSLWQYSFDAEDRVIGMATSSGAVGFGAPNYSLAFKYDYLGRRVEKTVYLNSVKTFDRKYVYQGSLLIAEIDAGTNQIVQSYTWGPDRSGTIGGAGGIGGLLLVTAETSTSLTGYDVSYDGNGNVTALLGVDGSLAAAYEYDPYGQMVRRQGPAAASNPFEFSTKYTDVETGMVYYGRRYYDSNSGRFINRDPSGESGGLNLFRFVSGDPIDQVDPFGLSDQTEVTATIEVNDPRMQTGQVIYLAGHYLGEDDSSGTASPTDSTGRKVEKSTATKSQEGTEDKQPDHNFKKEAKGYAPNSAAGSTDTVAYGRDPNNGAFVPGGNPIVMAPFKVGPGKTTYVFGLEGSYKVIDNDSGRILYYHPIPGLQDMTPMFFAGASILAPARAVLPAASEAGTEVATQAVTISAHGMRHFPETAQTAVQAAIRQDLAALGNVAPGQIVQRTITVGSEQVTYRAFGLQGGTVNVGTAFPGTAIRNIAKPPGD